jgi:hypothetical protein
MFSLSDRVRIGRVLAGAGFTGVSIDAIRLPHRFGPTAARAAEAFLASGPTRYIVEQDDDLTWQRALARLTAALEPYAGPEGVFLRGAQWLVSAVWAETDAPRRI